MNANATIVISVLSAGLVSYAVTRASAPKPTTPETLTPEPHLSTASLADGQRQLAEAVEALTLEVATLRDRASGTRLPALDVEAAVARYLREMPEETSAELAANKPESEALPEAADFFAQLLELDSFGTGSDELWRKAREAGRTDELLALFEAQAEADPNNPDKRVDLGEAYIQKIQEVGNGPQAGVYATKADTAFDAALAIDDQHWKARFSKAISLSFWPPVFGKQATAIEQFEVLAGQQSSANLQPEFVQTHLLLGNLYHQTGQMEKAVSAWTTGLELFPDNQDLLQQLAVAGE